MKNLLITALLLSSSCAYAVPNYWVSDGNMGIREFTITNEKKQQIVVSCIEGEGVEQSPTVSFESNGKSYSNSLSEYPLSFLFDGKLEAIPTESTKWVAGQQAWDNFRFGVYKARKIEVFLNNKKVATFTPNVTSISKTAKYIKACEPTL